MGKVTGFIEIPRKKHPTRPAGDRVHDWHEVYLAYPEAGLKDQAARCMDCGIPFCHNGCPLGNLIPDWNDLVYRDHWREAIDHGLAHRGQHDHADAGQPHLVLEQVREQGQVQGLGGRGGRGGHPLQDRRQAVEQRRKQREQNRHHRGILAAWLADVAVALGHGGDQATRKMRSCRASVA
jgi:hypothetical protein